MNISYDTIFGISFVSLIYAIFGLVRKYAVIIIDMVEEMPYNLDQSMHPV